jgi:hypothetical protein
MFSKYGYYETSELAPPIVSVYGILSLSVGKKYIFWRYIKSASESYWSRNQAFNQEKICLATTPTLFINHICYTGDDFRRMWILWDLGVSPSHHIHMFRVLSLILLRTISIKCRYCLTSEIDPQIVSVYGMLYLVVGLFLNYSGLFVVYILTIYKSLHRNKTGSETLRMIRMMFTTCGYYGTSE